MFLSSIFRCSVNVVAEPTHFGDSLKNFMIYKKTQVQEITWTYSFGFCWHTRYFKKYTTHYFKKAYHYASVLCSTCCCSSKHHDLIGCSIPRAGTPPRSPHRCSPHRQAMHCNYFFCGVGHCKAYERCGPDQSNDRDLTSANLKCTTIKYAEDNFLLHDPDYFTMVKVSSLLR